MLDKRPAQFPAEDVSIEEDGSITVVLKNEADAQSFYQEIIYEGGNALIDGQRVTMLGKSG